MRNVESSIIYYGESTGFFADQMLARGPSYLQAAVLYENLVVEANLKPRMGATPAPKQVAIYPKEGAFITDHPFVIPDADWVTPAKHAAAQVFRDFLLATPQQQKALALGFRPSPQSHLAIYDAAKSTPPAAQTIAMITNDRDVAVNNVLARDLARRWQATAPRRVTNYVFGEGSMLDHDIIDPTQKNQCVEYVYPILLDLCGARNEDKGRLRQVGGQGG